MSKKCDANFTTQYGFVNGEIFNINQLSKGFENITCEHGHPLVLCDGRYIKKYLRHKNSNDVFKDCDMSDWHKELQGLFQHTECQYIKCNKEQYKDRRADVYLDKNHILELQHSNIEYSEVICRHDDYSLHGVDVIWLVDGNTKDVILDELHDGTYLIEFKLKWKYKSFSQKYDYILLDIGGKIFKIAVKLVCNKMFRAKEYKNRDDVVDVLTYSAKDIWSLWSDETNEVKPTLTIKQEGAGNGKTFGIWKTISLSFDKSTYIICTKQHTAKEVIFKELNDQANRNEFHIVDNMIEIIDERESKQIKVRYKHKYSGRECLVIIGTVDSFVWSLTSKSIGGNNLFEGLLKNIIQNGCDKINKNNGEMKYAQEFIKLNKMCEVWLDESQDLPILYYKAIVKVILNTKIDCVVVGDKLQSLEYEENFMTHIEPSDYINIIHEPPKNMNRRIKVKHMAEQINTLVNFEKFDVPKITIENEDELEYRYKDTIETFKQKVTKKDPETGKTIDLEVDNIIEMVDKEVQQFGYKPNDFLFIFPIMKNNTVAGELETALNEYWVNALGYEDEYKQFAVLHRHEEGTVIDTSKSVDASRIMSIKASKGDGRSVVFVLGVTENTLKLFSNHEKNVIYESMLHVAITRAKHKIYFGLNHNNDDIRKRFSMIDDNIKYEPSVSKSSSLNNILRYIDSRELEAILQNNGVKEFQDEGNNMKSTPIIDWEYHCVRRSIFHIYVIFEIYKLNNNERFFDGTQLKVVLDNISKMRVKCVNGQEFYGELKDKSKSKIPKELNYIPVWNNETYSHKRLSKKLKDSILSIQLKYRKDKLSIGDLNPFECSILRYCIDVCCNKIYHEITPSLMYNIIKSFESGGDEKELIEETKNIKNVMSKLLNEEIFKKDGISWNIEHVVNFNGHNDNLKIHTRFPIIGHCDTTVYHFKLVTDLSRINYTEIMNEIVLERFIINNANSNDRDVNNMKRFSKKRIITILVILKKNTYEILDWAFDDNIKDQMKIILKNALCKKYNNHNIEYYNYCKSIKTGSKSEWESFKSPYQFISNELFRDGKPKPPIYVKNFFDYLHGGIKSDSRAIKQITDSFELFDEKMNNFIQDMCDEYFGINSHINDDVEW